MENIIVKIYNNYKQFCVENKLDIKTGKSKQLQMNNIGRFYNYYKEGNKIFVLI